MYDLSFFRNNLDPIAKRLADRGYVLPDDFRQIDTERRAAITESEQLKAQLNAASKEIAEQKKLGADTSARQEQIREKRARAAELEAKAFALDEAFKQLLSGVPNLPHETVPTGRSAEDNVEVRRVGTPPQFSFEP